MPTLDDLEKMKLDKMTDILRRVVANPGSLEEVAREIALDWMPMFWLDPDGKFSIVVGTGAKK